MQVISRADAKTQCLKRFFTGEPCVYGHVAERRVSDYGCVECSRLKARDQGYRERRREYFRDHQRCYRAEHPDRIKATDDKRKEKQAANTRKRRANNPEPSRAALRRSFQKHKTKRMAETQAWRERNRPASRVHMRNAKAKRRAAEGSFTKRDVDRLFIEQHGRCAGCFTDLGADYHVDHKTPLARGGTNWPDNLQLLCQPCNLSKGAKTMGEWIVWWIQMVPVRR